MRAKKVQGTTTFAEIDELVLKHLQARDWDDLPARDLATSITLEASELLEHFQWSDNLPKDKQALADELADVLIYCFEFAQVTDIDMAKAIKQKLEKTARKYPAEKFKSKSSEERRNAWINAKINHKKEGL